MDPLSAAPAGSVPRLELSLQAPSPTPTKLGGCLLVLFGTVALGMAAVLLGAAWWPWLLGFDAALWLALLLRPQPPPLPLAPPVRLLLFDECLVLQTGDDQQVYPLDAALHVRLEYEGYRGEEHYRRGHRTLLTGYHNYLRLNTGLTHPFVVPDQATEEALRWQLHHWYTRRVDVREFRRYDYEAGQLSDRTLLLRREPDYDEQMALLREHGFSLYGRPGSWGTGPSPADRPLT